MRFQLANALGMLESRGLPVPGFYQEYVYTFADPAFVSHPFVDIIVQERKVQHFIIASYVEQEEMFLRRSQATVEAFVFSQHMEMARQATGKYQAAHCRDPAGGRI